MLSRDRVNSAEYIPVNESSARWSGDGSFVNPSVFTIYHFHQSSIIYHINKNLMISVCINGEVIPFQWVEESVHKFLLGPWKFWGVFVYGEHDSDSCISNIILCFFCQMHSMHLEIVSHSIYRMLGSCVEMELSSREFVGWSKDFLSQFRFESITSIGLIKI